MRPYLSAQEGWHPQHYLNQHIHLRSDMAIFPVLLPFILNILLPLAQAGTEQHSSRLVVTFRTASDNGLGVLDNFNFLNGTRVVKQYGRRLVLDLGAPFDLETERVKFAVFESVQSVETDFLIGLEQTDPPLLVSDALLVTNATDPDVDGALISPATQTPLWNLMDSEPYSIHAEGVWHVTNSTPDVVVAIIDTGMAELAKPMFINLLDGYDFISDDGISIDWDGRDPDATDPGDWGDMCPTPSWHGAKVASILAARHDNGFGMKGVAQNCSVLPVRVLGLCRMGYATDVTDAIVWSAGGTINGVPDNANPAKIISLSLAGQGACPDYLQSAVSQAVGLGSVVIAAAGNSNQNVSGFFPANCKGVISVAASTREGKLAGYSNWGAVIAAPGGDTVNAIMTLSVNEMEDGLQVAFGMGTSLAAPHIAGVGCLFLGKKMCSDCLISYLNIKTDKIMDAGPIHQRDFQKVKTNVTVKGSECSEFHSCCNNDPCSWDESREECCSYCGCSDGQYKSIEWSGSCTAEVCRSCARCSFGSFNYECRGNPGYCQQCPQCSSGSYITSCSEFGDGSDRVCGQCAACGAGSYWSVACTGTAAGTCSGCVTCGAGSYWSVACTGTAAGTCSGCTACGAGSYWSAACTGTAAGTCSGCTANSYCLGGTSPPAAWTKTTCLAGTYLSPTPSASVDGACPVCTASSYCPGGTSQPVAWATCAAGTYQTTPPTASVNRECAGCTGDSYCPGGTSPPVGWATCAAGTYQTGAPSTLVNRACSTGCTTGKYCLGGTSPPAAWTKTTCLAGTYLSPTPSASVDGACPVCTASRYCPGGTSQPVTWKNCGFGTYQTVPPTASVNRECTGCTDSHYCIGGTSPPVGWATCAAGTYQTNPPSTSLDRTCSTGCTPGKYCLGGTNIPVTCSPNPPCISPQFIQSCTATSNAQCADCNNAQLPSNSHWMDGQLDNCVWACNRAPAYYFKTGTACTACKTPSSCLSGTYVTTCTLTVDGGCTSCNNKPALNSYYTSNSPQYDISSCDWSCNAGYKKEANACVACGTGTYSLQGVDTCSICLAGTFTQSTGQSTCSVCLPGTFSPPLLPSATVGAAGCTSCTAGTYSYTESSTTCLSCSPTGYTPTSGATACTPCPVCTSTGDYRKDCAGTLQGTCEKCTSTT